MKYKRYRVIKRHCIDGVVYIIQERPRLLWKTFIGDKSVRSMIKRYKSCKNQLIDHGVAYETPMDACEALKRILTERYINKKDSVEYSWTTEEIEYSMGIRLKHE